MLLIACPHCGKKITLYITDAPMLLNEYGNICPHCQKEYNVKVEAVEEAKP